MKYSIGQYVWYAQCDYQKLLMTCPDCGGAGRIRMIFHDGEEVSVACGACCREEFALPTGQVSYYDTKPGVIRVCITGVESRGGKTRYYFDPNRVSDEDHLFPTKEEAEALAIKMAEEIKNREIENIVKKEKDTKSWAWNASYYRDQIRDAEKKIKYYTAKLNAANLKVKDG